MDSTETILGAREQAKSCYSAGALTARELITEILRTALDLDAVYTLHTAKGEEFSVNSDLELIEE